MLLDVKNMSKALREVVVLMSFLAIASTVAAGPITGSSTLAPPPADTESTDRATTAERDDRPAGTAAFDATALFDLSGLPLLRVGAPIFVTLEGRDKLRGQRLMQPDVVGGMVSGAPGDIGNVSFTPETGPVVVANPGGGSGGPTGAIPEPSLWMLLAPVAAAQAWRLRMRSATR
jgi:hypothetical protein